MDWFSYLMKYSPIAAIALNFVGAILLLFSTGAYRGGGIHWAAVDSEGKMLKSVYYLNPLIFKIGIILMVLGFFIHIVNEAISLGWLNFG